MVPSRTSIRIVHVNILVDPTLLMTMRGQQWIHRVAEHGQLDHLATSAAFWKVLVAGDTLALAAYRLPWFGWGYRSVDLYGLPQINLVGTDANDEVGSCLVNHGPSGPIAADLWTGLRSGGCLAARRPATLDLFVRAGARLVVEGPSRYERQLARISKTMDPELVGALARRARFLVVQTRAGTRSSLAVFDAGKAGYR